MPGFKGINIETFKPPPIMEVKRPVFEFRDEKPFPLVEKGAPSASTHGAREVVKAEENIYARLMTIKPDLQNTPGVRYMDLGNQRAKDDRTARQFAEGFLNLPTMLATGGILSLVGYHFVDPAVLYIAMPLAISPWSVKKAVELKNGIVNRLQDWSDEREIRAHPYANVSLSEGTHPPDSIDITDPKVRDQVRQMRHEIMGQRLSSTDLTKKIKDYTEVLRYFPVDHPEFRHGLEAFRALRESNYVYAKALSEMNKELGGEVFLAAFTKPDDISPERVKGAQVAIVEEAKSIAGDFQAKAIRTYVDLLLRFASETQNIEEGRKALQDPSLLGAIEVDPDLKQRASNASDRLALRGLAQGLARAFYSGLQDE